MSAYLAFIKPYISVGWFITISTLLFINTYIRIAWRHNGHVKYACKIVFILLVLSVPVGYAFNKRQVSIQVISGNEPVSMASLRVHEINEEFRTNSLGIVNFDAHNRYNLLNIDVSKKGYKPVTSTYEINSHIIKILITPDMNVKKTNGNYVEYNAKDKLIKIPLSFELIKNDNNGIELDLSKIKIALDDAKIQIKSTQQKSDKINAVAHIDISKNDYSNKYCKLYYDSQLLYNDKMYFVKAYIFPGNKNDVKNSSYTTPAHNGLIFWSHKNMDWDPLWLKDIIEFDKPFTLSVESELNSEMASLMLNIGQNSRILIGEQSLKTVKSQVLLTNKQWKTVDTQSLEYEININMPLIINLTYLPKDSMRLDVRYFPKNEFKKPFKSSLKIDCFDIKLFNKVCELGVGAVLYSSEPIKAVTLKNVKFIHDNFEYEGK